MKCHCGNEAEFEGMCRLCKFASCALCCDCSQACISNNYIHVGEPNWWFPDGE